MVETIRQINDNVPPSFLTRNEAQRFLKEGLSLGELERLKLLGVINSLADPQLEQLIDEGNITLGVIKPNANQGKYDTFLSDEEATARILREIEERIVFKISVQLTQQQAEDFYGSIKEKYNHELTPWGTNLWESIVNHASSGPLTFILIYDKDGQAIEWWRKKMGNTHPVEANPESLRGKYGIEENLPNNLVHGSDNKFEIKRELAVLRNVLETFL